MRLCGVINQEVQEMVVLQRNMTFFFYINLHLTTLLIFKKKSHTWVLVIALEIKMLHYIMTMTGKVHIH